MTWSVETLRKAVLGRGEHVPSDRDVAAALLAHERYRGRTEESYDRSKAYGEMKRILERMEAPFPDKQRGEYPGLTQLHAIARELERARKVEREQELRRRIVTDVGIAADETEQDMDDDRGM